MPFYLPNELQMEEETVQILLEHIQTDPTSRQAPRHFDRILQHHFNANFSLRFRPCDNLLWFVVYEATQCHAYLQTHSKGLPDEAIHRNLWGGDQRNVEMALRLRLYISAR